MFHGIAYAIMAETLFSKKYNYLEPYNVASEKNNI
jgi:hypothetical protein